MCWHVKWATQLSSIIHMYFCLQASTQAQSFHKLCRRFLDKLIIICYCVKCFVKCRILIFSKFVCYFFNWLVESTKCYAAIMPEKREKCITMYQGDVFRLPTARNLFFVLIYNDMDLKNIKFHIWEARNQIFYCEWLISFHVCYY